MSTKDVLDQIRDLQSVIDEFAADGTNRSPSPILFQKPNEITDDENVKQEQTNREEKILIETKPELLLEKCNLNLSDDFSSLVEQFKQKQSPASTKLPKKQIDLFQHRKRELSLNTSQEKIQVEDQKQHHYHHHYSPYQQQQQQQQQQNIGKENVISITNNSSNYITNNNSNINLFNTIPASTTSSPRSSKMSRRTSASSKKSQRSVKSTRQKSQRRHKHQQQQHHQKQDKYVERSYDEMMRIPDIFERVSFYEKTLNLCLQAESPISNWIKKNSEKGLPKPLTEDYTPPTGSTSLESMTSDSFSISSPFSGTIAPFLKKSGSQSTPRPTHSEHRPFMTPTTHTMQSLFGKSISRLNLSRSAAVGTTTTASAATSTTLQMPRYDTSSEHTRFAKTPRINRQYRSSLSPTEEKLPFQLTPKTPHYHHQHHHQQQSFSCQKTSTNKTKALNYMTNVLPQIDIDVLSNALEEAKGDPMLAITLAVSQTKKQSKNDHFITSRR